MKKIVLPALAAFALAITAEPRAQELVADGAVADAAASAGSVLLRPTDHPRLSRDISQLWLVPARLPSRGRGATSPDAVEGIKLVGRGGYEKALPALVAPGVAEGPLGDYARYYAGIAQMHVNRFGEARRSFQLLSARPLVGYLVEAAAVGEAEADEALNEPGAAVAVYERLLKGKIGSTDDMLLRLGRVARAAGDTAKALEAFSRVYYDFPLSDLAPSAGSELARFSSRPPLSAGSDRYRQELQRAERLFAARQYSAARGGFEALRGVAGEEDRQLIGIRLAECDYFLKRPRIARDAMRPYTSAARHQAEALYYYALLSNDVGDKAEYLVSIRRLNEEFPNDSWTEAALDDLATQYILQDDDDGADRTFRQMYDRFPRGPFAERAAWKIGWRAYRQQHYDETVRVFERAAADFPRSDYRPPWLYWSGRAREQLGDRATAQQRYLLTATDYLNSYYGRLAASRLDGLVPITRVVAAADVQAPDPRLAPPPNAAIIRRLLEVQLYADALNELRFAGRMWGDSPAIQATIAWIHQQQGQVETGSRRFTLVRGAITTMRRAYPQFMAAGGEELPAEILGVIFPLAYWDLIRKFSGERGLDPYLVAALVAQESTFVPDIKSYANAVGLMQLMSFTGRQYAKKLGIRYSAAVLTSPETNIKLGTAYFADKIKEFGDVYLALASYNAGEGAVHKWMSERSGVPRDEFIDDIPYPQTQNYVKRILGTAEDYRRLYGGGSRVEELVPAVKVASRPQGVGAPPSSRSASSKKAPARKASPKKPATKKAATRAASRKTA